MITKIEAGKVDLTLSKVEKIAWVLDVAPAYLTGFSEWQDNQDKALELSSLIKQASKLDDADLARIAERIDILLEQAKYNEN